MFIVGRIKYILRTADYKADMWKVTIKELVVYMHPNLPFIASVIIALNKQNKVLAHLKQHRFIPNTLTR